MSNSFSLSPSTKIVSINTSLSSTLRDCGVIKPNESERTVDGILPFANERSI
ncbi:hypothetical protein DFA_02141 [Cavenderia fasciculata]|uniref:Uncharacterized protein n=1 Tax=Cavenderia fasciculata TaxID=261658 RepID=F4PYT8_CACFS|nr:uncharacterized protein DFA_02141 [Cavenderia fasciculata]EGG19354.1 hypothetical protein DFA_02141 [Cavenderia fasciculata]|eukprot:XP_004357625.1 hypothetical protein DFA_02141 [Cavenderia fasciculata]